MILKGGDPGGEGPGWRGSWRGMMLEEGDIGGE